jgi:glycosyltransferase involved in cell wall biosynthesis
MRILHVINHGTARGGAERLAADLIEQQRQDGHEVHVLTSDLPGGGDRFADSFWPASGADLLAKLRHHYWNGAARKTLATVVRRWHPDVVHLHTVGLLSPAALPVLRDVPTVMTLHGPELFLRGTVRWCLPAGYFRAGCRLNRLTVRGLLAGAWAVIVTGPVWRHLLRRHVDLFVAPSTFIAELTRRSLAPARVGGNGVHDAYLAAGRRLPHPTGGAPRLVMAGRLEDFKGPHVMLAAMPAILARHSDARLTIVGAGPFGTALERIAVDLGVRHAVTAVGWLSPTALAAVMADSHVTVVPSVWPEAFGLTALEALAAGCPVVASEAGGLLDLIRHDETGLLVPPGDATALAGAVIRLIADPALRTRLSHAGRDVARRYAMPLHAAAVEDVYRDARQAWLARGRHVRGEPQQRIAPSSGGYGQ